MPNPILTRAIEAVCSDQDLTTDHAAAVLAEVMSGAASEVPPDADAVLVIAPRRRLRDRVERVTARDDEATAVERGLYSLWSTK